MQPAQLADQAMPSVSRNSSTATPLPCVESFAALGLQLSRQLAQCRRVGERMAMLWVEVEWLTGQDAAGSVEIDGGLLQAAGQRLRHRVRGTDEVVQVGKQGFAVLLKSAGQAEANVVEQRLKQALTGAYGVAERRLYLGVSLGMATFPECGRTGTELAEAARRSLALRQGA